jgi:hypothetical protein
LLGYRQIETGHISRIYEGHARKKDFGLSCSMPGLTHSPGGMKYGVKRRLQKLGFSSQNLKSKEAFFTRWGEITVPDPREDLFQRGCLTPLEQAVGVCRFTVLLLLRKLALEMTFNIFTAKRVSCFGQYDRIDDLILCNLRGHKCPVFRQFLVDEFHYSAVFKCFDPLFVWHFRISSGEIRVCREYTLFGARNRGWGMKSRLLGIWHSNGAGRTTTENCPCCASLCPNKQLPKSLDGRRGENAFLESRCAVCINPRT